MVYKKNKSFAVVKPGKYRHNSIKNDYSGGKLRFMVSQLGLWGQLG